jgi:hypothetical protein
MWRWSPDEDRTYRLVGLPGISPTTSIATTRKAA